MLNYTEKSFLRETSSAPEYHNGVDELLLVRAVIRCECHGTSLYITPKVGGRDEVGGPRDSRGEEACSLNLKAITGQKTKQTSLPIRSSPCVNAAETSL